MKGQVDAQRGRHARRLVPGPQLGQRRAHAHDGGQRDVPALLHRRRVDGLGQSGYAVLHSLSVRPDGQDGHVGHEPGRHQGRHHGRRRQRRAHRQHELRADRAAGQHELRHDRPERDRRGADRDAPDGGRRGEVDRLLLLSAPRPRRRRHPQDARARGQRHARLRVPAGGADLLRLLVHLDPRQSHVLRRARRPARRASSSTRGRRSRATWPTTSRTTTSTRRRRARRSSRTWSGRRCRITASRSEAGSGARAPRSAGRRRAEAGLRHDRLEQLDRIAGWVLEQDLLATDAGHDVVAEARSRSCELRDLRGQIIDLDRKPIPPAGCLPRPSGMGCPPPAPDWARSARAGGRPERALRTREPDA